MQTIEDLKNLEQKKALYYFVYYIIQEIKSLVFHNYNIFEGSGQRLDLEVSSISSGPYRPYLSIKTAISETVIATQKHILVNDIFLLINKHLSDVYDYLMKAGFRVSMDEQNADSCSPISINGSIGRFVQLFKDCSEDLLSSDCISQEEAMSIERSFSSFFEQFFNIMKTRDAEEIINSEVERLAIDIIEGKVGEAKDKKKENAKISLVDVFNFINGKFDTTIFRIQDDINIYVATQMVFNKIGDILGDIEMELASYSDFKLSTTMDAHETAVIAVDINVGHTKFKKWWERYTAKLSIKDSHNECNSNGLDTKHKVEVLEAIGKQITQNRVYLALKEYGELQDAPSVDGMFVVYNVLSAGRYEEKQHQIAISLVIPYNLNYSDYYEYIESFAKACGYSGDLRVTARSNNEEREIGFTCELIDLLDCYIWEAGYIQRDLMPQEAESSKEKEDRPSLLSFDGITFKTTDRTLRLARKQKEE